MKEMWCVRVNKIVIETYKFKSNFNFTGEHFLFFSVLVFDTQSKFYYILYWKSVRYHSHEALSWPVLFSFNFQTSITGSIYMTVAIALERYIAVHYPLHYNQVSTVIPCYWMLSCTIFFIDSKFTQTNRHSISRTIQSLAILKLWVQLKIICEQLLVKFCVICFISVQD
jgi:hypothetical protein